MARYSKVQDFIDKKGPLTGAETRLLEAVRTGRSCYLPTGDKADVTLPKAADDTVTIRADFLRILISGGSAECGLDGLGVSLFGAWIDGKLDLAFSTARGLTQMDSCHFTDAPIFYQAHLKQLALNNSHLPGLMAQGMQVDGSVFLRQITATGTVDVNAASIGGTLEFEGATLDGGKDGNGTALRALHAQAVEVGQSLFLSRIIATGTVAVNGARIGGQLDCEGATLDGGKDSSGTALPALHAQGVVVGQSLFLRQITATGTVDVNGARIGGQLDCEGATLDGGKDSAGTALRALNAQRLHVAHSFFFRELKKVTGRIDLTAAHVGDLVDDIASWPLGEDDLILDGFTYDRLAGTAPTSFDARKGWLRAGSHWRGEFRPQPYTQLARVLRGMGHEREARRVLIAGQAEQAKAHMGFRRQRRRLAHAISRFSRRREEKRLDAVAEAAKGLPTALDQLGKDWLEKLQSLVMIGPRPANAPPPESAMTMEYARQQFGNDLRWQVVKDSTALAGMWVKDVGLRGLVGYGYAPHRALVAAAVLWAMASGLAHMAWEEGSFAPNSDVILVSDDWQQRLAGDCVVEDDPAPVGCRQNPAADWSAKAAAGMDWDSFNAVAYGADIVVPLLALGQEAAWAPSKDRGPWGKGLWWGRWVLTVAGWIVTALGAAAVTGLIRRDRGE